MRSAASSSAARSCLRDLRDGRVDLLGVEKASVSAVSACRSKRSVSSITAASPRAAHIGDDRPCKLGVEPGLPGIEKYGHLIPRRLSSVV
jgi:hypothetical protein